MTRQLGKQNKTAPNLSEIECYVLDMDGTINLGNTVIEGAHEFVSLLEKKGTPFFFFTNNSSRSPETYVKRLHGLGFSSVTRDQIMTSGDVMIHVLKRDMERPQVFLAGTPALEEQFEAAGIELLGTDCRRADYAVLGFDTTFNYSKAEALCRLVASGTPFLATNIDRVCPLENDAFLPDCASLAAMIEYATGVAPRFVGKPFVETSRYILERTGIPASKTAIVGDRVYTDMKTAVNGGMIGIAVLTGELGWEDLEADSMPDYVLESVDDLRRELTAD